jgi:hypothetical protein
MDTTSRVRELNDEARRYLTDGEILVSCGISDLPYEEQGAILEAVRTFEDFTPQNDPYGEHDFGAFERNGRRIFWKIECCDRETHFASPDPADPAVTRRIVNVMLAEEY